MSDVPPPVPPRRSPWDPPPGANPPQPAPDAGPTAPPSPSPVWGEPPPPVPAEPSTAPPAYGSWTPTPPPGGVSPPSEPVLGTRGQRYGGPRFGGRAVVMVFGLLGVLLTIGIMAVLAVQVLKGADGGPASVDLGAGAGTVTTVAGAPAGPAQPNPTAPVDAAARQRCLADRSTVATAAEAYNVMNGTYPPDVQTLVTEGLLTPDGELNLTLQVQGDSVQVVGTGPCAGI